MQEQMSNVSIEYETLRKNQKAMLEDKGTAMERKDASMGSSVD